MPDNPEGSERPDLIHASSEDLKKEQRDSFLVRAEQLRAVENKWKSRVMFHQLVLEVLEAGFFDEAEQIAELVEDPNPFGGDINWIYHDIAVAEAKDGMFERAWRICKKIHYPKASNMAAAEIRSLEKGKGGPYR